MVGKKYSKAEICVVLFEETGDVLASSNERTIDVSGWFGDAEKWEGNF